MENLLNAAVNKETNEKYNFFLSGDLCQMSTQRNFLSNRGFDLKQNDVYPCLKDCDKKMALKLIWENKVEGWWHYKDEYIKLNICKKEDFNKKLNIACENQ